MTSLELAINKLAKWRSVFAGWQLGTRAKGEPDQAYERRFPGFKATQMGMDIDVAKARETTKGWKP